MERFQLDTDRKIFCHFCTFAETSAKTLQKLLHICGNFAEKYTVLTKEHAKLTRQATDIFKLVIKTVTSCQLRPTPQCKCDKILYVSLSITEMKWKMNLKRTFSERR